MLMRSPCIRFSGGQSSRRGSLLVVIMGLILILLGMTVAISVRVNAGMSDSELAQRHAQSYLMMHAVKTYVDVRFAQVMARVAGGDAGYTSYYTAKLSANSLELIREYKTGFRAMTGGDGGDLGLAAMSAMTQSATASATNGLGTFANRLGWFSVVESFTPGQAYVIAAGGGGGTNATGSEQTKRNPANIHGGTLGSSDPRDSYDAVTYYSISLPTVSASASVVVQPAAGRSATGALIVDGATQHEIWGKK